MGNLQVSIVFREGDGVFYLKSSESLESRTNKLVLQHENAVGAPIPEIKRERAGRVNFKSVGLWLDGITLSGVDQASMDA